MWPSNHFVYHLSLTVLFTPLTTQVTLILHQGYIPEKVAQIEITQIEYKIPI
jgi:hypothetical protein